jgi:predicted TIM-barrel fold metal-dependent hydrolase
MAFEVIDFHCHPFITDEERIGAYVDTVDMKTADFFAHMESAGVSLCCGSVIGAKIHSFADLHTLNLHALALRDRYPGRYLPGIHIHPGYVEESVREVDFAVANGVKMIGELVPYHHGWEDYSTPQFVEIMEYINEKNLLVNVHIASAADLEQMEKSVAACKDTVFVLAHPGHGERLEKHIELLGRYENVYLDLSGSGIDLFGALRRIIAAAGYERLLFGSDFPVTSVKTCAASVLSEHLPEHVTECILSRNAKKLLGIL